MLLGWCPLLEIMVSSASLVRVTARKTDQCTCDWLAATIVVKGRDCFRTAKKCAAASAKAKTAQMWAAGGRSSVIAAKHSRDNQHFILADEYARRVRLLGIKNQRLCDLMSYAEDCVIALACSAPEDLQSMVIRRGEINYHVRDGHVLLLLKHPLPPTTPFRVNWHERVLPSLGPDLFEVKQSIQALNSAMITAFEKFAEHKINCNNLPWPWIVVDGTVQWKLVYIWLWIENRRERLHEYPYVLWGVVDDVEKAEHRLARSLDVLADDLRGFICAESRALGRWYTRLYVRHAVQEYGRSAGMEVPEDITNEVYSFLCGHGEFPIEDVKYRKLPPADTIIRRPVCGREK